MNLYATDKEYKERFDYFLEEVKNEHGKVIEHRIVENENNLLIYISILYYKFNHQPASENG